MLNKKSVDDINVKGKKVLVRCDFNVPLQEGKITDENREKFKEAVEPMYEEYKEKLGNEIFDIAQEFNK